MPVVKPLSKRKTRVALFGSYFRGYCVLGELLYGEIRDRLEIVGVATDDVAQPFVSPAKRVWQYPHLEHEKTMVRRLAERENIEVFDGRIKSSEFYRRYEQAWQPDLCVAATFGQFIDSRLFGFPRLGFFNLHPCIDDGWPSRYAGSNPFHHLLADGHRYAVIAMHRVDEQFDHGELIAYSERVFFPPQVGVTDLHKMTGPIAAKLAAREIARLIATRDALPQPPAGEA